jgi:hypothetical protein
VVLLATEVAASKGARVAATALLVVACPATVAADQAMKAVPATVAQAVAMVVLHRAATALRPSGTMAAQAEVAAATEVLPQTEAALHLTEMSTEALPVTEADLATAEEITAANRF